MQLKQCGLRHKAKLLRLRQMCSERCDRDMIRGICTIVSTQDYGYRYQLVRYHHSPFLRAGNKQRRSSTIVCL